ncbi:MAG: cobalt ECF transporter T component CbiQ [Acidimicrobiales bacterium]|nr:cobalt ECF transporter T component CbiQ [Acidimicrobiales bacterium]
MTRAERLPAHVKVVGALVFVFGVVATPRTAVPALLVDAVAVAVVAGLARVRASTVLRRLVIEVPFLAFALLLPFVARGEQVVVAGVAVSEEGLWAAWNILAKGTIGVAVAVVLSATTPAADLLAGLDRLRVPVAFTAIGGFMVRFGAVLGGEVERLRIARISRGDDPRWLWQARSVATTAGALFVRSFERGERVHVAMVSRGFDGTWPRGDDVPAPPSAWLAAGAFAAVSVVGATVALVAVSGVG